MNSNEPNRNIERGLYEYLEHEDGRLSSDNLEVLESMLREELARQNTDAFNVIRLIERIQEGAYRHLPGFESGSGKTVDDYFRIMPERIGVPKQTVSRLRKIANAYLKHVMDFATYGVNPLEGVSKLVALEQAIENHPGRKAEVFEHFKTDTVRVFEEYAGTHEASEGIHRPQVPESMSTSVAVSPNPRLVEAENLEKDHRTIAEALTRRNRVIILPCPTVEHAEALNERLSEYRGDVLERLTSDAGMQLPLDEPLNVPEGANLFDIEEAIKRYQKSDQVSKAKVAVGVYRVSTEEVLIQQSQKQGFNTVREYCDRRLNIGSEYSWFLRIGKAIVTYCGELKAAGFTMNGQLYKLAYLESALERARDDEERRIVFQRLRTDSFRAFRNFASDDIPIGKAPILFHAAVVDRASRALKRATTIKEHGEVPAILEVQSQVEENMIRAYDAETRPGWGAADDRPNKAVA